MTNNSKPETNMKSRISVRKTWITAFETMVRHPIIILPFFIVAFLEGLALELIYFSTRKPLSVITAPIIRKLSGEAFLHYPFNLIKLPKLFFYSQFLIYIFAGVFLAAISINIFKNIKTGLPLRTNALIKNAANRYVSFVGFGILTMALIFLLGKTDTLVFSKLSKLISTQFPNISPNIYPIGSTAFLFLTNLIMYTFIVLTLPIIVIKKESLLKAVARSIALGFRNFFRIFALLFTPLLLYLPVTLLKVYSTNLAGRTFPEIIVWVAAIGIIISVFLDCFIIVCAAQFVMDS